MESKNLDQKFNEYHTQNPNVYDLFKRYSIQLKESGHKHYGAKTIMERIRWHIDVESKGDKFKINNNYTSRYVRMLVAEIPAFAEFFRTRELLSRKAAA